PDPLPWKDLRSAVAPSTTEHGSGPTTTLTRRQNPWRPVTGSRQDRPRHEHGFDASEPPMARARTSTPAPAVPTITESRYFPWLDDMSKLTTWHMVTRAPRLVVHILQVAWRAARGDTVLTLALHTAAGVVTAVSLIVVVDVLDALFTGTFSTGHLQQMAPSLVLLA